MSATTGPILAVAAVTLVNRSVFHDEPFDWRVPIAAGVAAGGFAALEKVAPSAATALAWMALGTVLLTRIGGVESPAESFLTWWNAGGNSGKR